MFFSLYHFRTCCQCDNAEQPLASEEVYQYGSQLERVCELPAPGTLCLPSVAPRGAGAELYGGQLPIAGEAGRDSPHLQRHC